MLTSLQEIEQDGPSAFKDPRKIVECASHKTHAHDCGCLTRLPP